MVFAILFELCFCGVFVSMSFAVVSFSVCVVALFVFLLPGFVCFVLALGSTVYEGQVPDAEPPKRDANAPDLGR